MLLSRALSRDYPRALQRIDTTLYKRLGLINHSVKGRPPASRAWYDPSEHKLLLRRTPMPGQALVVNELVRALVDQNYGLGRVVGLRTRDRDRALAAKAIVDGTAALASGLDASPLSGTPLERFQQLEVSAGLGPGRALAAELKAYGRLLNIGIACHPAILVEHAAPECATGDCASLGDLREDRVAGRAVEHILEAWIFILELRDGLLRCILQIIAGGLGLWRS